MPRHQASGAAGQHHQKHDHGERVGGVAEKEDKPLNHGDLYQDVAEAHGDKVEQWPHPGDPRAGVECKRQDQESHDRDHRYA